MGGNTCAVSLKGLFIEHKEDTQTVSKQVRPALFRFDTRSYSVVVGGKNSRPCAKAFREPRV